MGMIVLNGKKSSQIANEYGVTRGRVNQYAIEHDLPFVSFDGGKTVEFYLFDEAAEVAFANRPLKSPGPPRKSLKPPKTPRKPGRPRKEKSVNTISVTKKSSVTASPKNPVGRPRKNPKEPLDIVKRSRGRLKK